MKPDLNLTKWNKASIYLSHSWKTKPSIWPPNMLGQLLLERNTFILSVSHHSPESKVNIKTCCFLCIHVHAWVHVHICSCWGHRTISGAISQEPSTLFYYQDKLSHHSPELGVQACAPSPDFSTWVLGGSSSPGISAGSALPSDFLLSNPKPWWEQQKDRLTGTGTVSCLLDLLFSFP